MAHDVFISYSSNDKSIADAVCATIESRQIRCWISPRDVLPGRGYGEEIIDAINDSRIMVVVFSSNANNSNHVENELERAVNKGIPILPFRIEAVAPSKSLEYFISRTHWLDALTPPLEKHINNLSEKVQLLLDKSGRSEPSNKSTSEHSSNIRYYTNTPFNEAVILADKWEKSGYPYYLLEGLGNDLKGFVMHPSGDMNIENSNVLNFLMSASIHFGGNWTLWIRNNNNKLSVIEHLIRLLNVCYDRPRYRALFALQNFHSEDIKSVLGKLKDGCSKDVHSLIMDYVVPRKVIDYLLNIKAGDDPELSKKASAVLREISRYYGVSF